MNARRKEALGIESGNHETRSWLADGIRGIVGRNRDGSSEPCLKRLQGLKRRAHIDAKRNHSHFGATTRWQLRGPKLNLSARADNDNLFDRGNHDTIIPIRAGERASSSPLAGHAGGSNQTVTAGYSAGPGYDLATGVGSPIGNSFVQYLATLVS